MSTITKNIVILLTGSGFSQLIPFIVLPILSRLYTSDDFGDLSLYVNVVSILVIIATGRFEEAILLPKKDSTSSYIMLGSIIAATIFSILILLLAIIIKYFVFSIYPADNISKWVLLVPISVFSISIYNVLSMFANRYRLYKYMSIGGFVKSAVTSIIKIGGGVKKLGAIGLVIGNVFGNISSALFISIICYRFKGYQLKYISLKKIRKALNIYTDFPKYNMPREIINSVSGSLPIFIFYKYFGNSVTGLYAMALALSYIPIQIFVQTIYQVYSEKIINDYNKRRAISKSIYKLIKIIALTFVVPFILIAIFAPNITVFILGDKWLESGIILQYLIPWHFVALVSKPIAFMPMLANKLKLEMIIDIILLILRIIALFIGVVLHDYYYSIVLFSITSVIILGIELRWFIYLAKKLDQKTLKLNT